MNKNISEAKKFEFAEFEEVKFRIQRFNPDEVELSVYDRDEGRIAYMILSEKDRVGLAVKLLNA